MPAEMMIEAADSTMISAAASTRNLVRKVSGRKAAKNSDFHTQSHFAAAASG